MANGTEWSRRAFVLDTSRFLAGGWLALQLPALAGCARDAAVRGAPFTLLTSGEASTLGVLADLILPADDLPGATEAGAVHFIDLALGGPFAAHANTIRGGLADLDARAAALDGADRTFADLTTEQAETVLRAVEETEFFALARMLTVMGVFSDPSYGGNRNGAGLTILGVEAHGSNAPPFGYYDGEALAAGARS
jgi:gluconate 2-dehydrogenase gamma chain